MDFTGTEAGAVYVPPSRFFEDGTALGRVLDEAPYLARCSDNKTAIRVRPREYALRYPYMQINRPGRVSWLIFDCDHDNPMIWKDAGLPQPNLAVRNRTNSHSHLYYAIPAVLTDEHARDKPIKYMKAVYEALATGLKADLAYHSGPVAKTPGHPWWETTEFHNHIYDLGELADYVKLAVTPWRGTPKLEDVEHSRHCILFEQMRYYAYSIVNQHRDTGSFDQFLDLLEAFAHNHNSFRKQGFSRDLLTSSLRSTVKSVARWTWNKYRGGGSKHRGVMQLDNSLPLAERQALGAKRTHQVRQKATESKIRAACASLRLQGKKLSQAAIALATRLTRQTVATYAHLLKEPLRNASTIRASNVKYGGHQIPAPVAPFDLCFKDNNQPLDGECAMPQYELVTIGSEAALAAPRDVYFNEGGVSAYSCLIPLDRNRSQRIHFVSGADGDEYGQFRCKELARDEAFRIVSRKNRTPLKRQDPA